MRIIIQSNMRGILFTASVIAVLSLMNSSLLAQTKLPARQASLHELSSGFCPLYKEGKNEIQQREVYERFIELRSELGSMIDWRISEWKGHVVEISTTQDGETAHVVIVSKFHGVEITYTDSRELETGGVQKDETVYDELRNLSEGDPVLFSASLSKDEGGLET